MSQDSEQVDNHNDKSNLITSKTWGGDLFISQEQLEKNILDVKKRIAHCKSKIIGVTKYYGLNAIVEGYNAGLRDFGESRAIESVRKIESLSSEIRKNSTFHFIGHLQTNKVNKVVEYFDYIHSVDSLKLAKVISAEACRLNKREKILLQVNNAEEVQKYGYSKEILEKEMPEILELENIDIVGLMNMAPLGASEQEIRYIFSDLRIFRDCLSKKFNRDLSELSMGMSDDYEIAAQEGSTMIRIGRKIFS